MLKKISINLIFVLGCFAHFFAAGENSSSNKNVECSKFIPRINEMKDSTKCRFVWIGSVNDGDGNEIDDFDVTVLSDDNNNEVLQKISARNDRICSINMPMNKKVIIILEKNGYVAKKIALNTEISNDLCNKKYVLSYSAILFKKEPNIDVSELNKPIAFIKYNKTKQEFSFDAKQVEKINNIIKKRYKDYYKKNVVEHH